MGRELESVTARLIAAQGQHEYSCDCSSSAVRPMQVPITTAGNLSLRAMALVLNRDPACLAADLLGAALADVQASCSADIQKQIRAAMHTIEQASLPENQPGTQFVAGGT